MELIFKNITLGSDPEFFIKNKNNEFISSLGIIEGDKHNPKELTILGPGFKIQKDNVLGEFNIPVAHSPEEAVEHIELMKSYISGMLSERELIPHYAASADYDAEQLDNDYAKEFGCCPDSNAWTGQQNPRPNSDGVMFRSAGCHIHVGWENPTHIQKLDLICAMDVFLGLPSVVVDTDSRRRILYGKAGCFRETSFGVEYRTLSGHVLKSRELEFYYFNQVIKAIDYIERNGIELILQEEKNITSAINNGDTELALNLMNKFGVEMFKNN